MIEQDILAEIDRPDGVVPVTSETVAVLVAEIKRLRVIIAGNTNTPSDIEELQAQANARRVRYGFNLA